ncbi:hypothetical protein ACKI1L_37930, partial [Streptomyces scabiei]|uniref:hypothetical protein n=1 Tax=Streptomyces scabiei TaxID=1930 RepID=UPI0038F62CFE
TLLTELDQARFREDFARIGRVLDDFYPQTLEASKVSGVDAGVSTSTTLEPALGKSSMVSSSNREPGIILVDLRAATKTAQKIALEN